jgi:hypothetical protein
MRRMLVALGLALTCVGGVSAEARSASLRGSPASMVEQNRVAKAHGLSFYRTAGEIRAAVASGELLELQGNADYDVADFVRFPYLHPAAVLFVERLAHQYREACGQKLVVTSAVRPSSGQPRNAHALSVHPAGMAVDLRVSDRASCRSWLESAVLGMERRGLINGIREFHPPHYHVAVYPDQYLAYAAERIAAEDAARAAEPAPAPAGTEGGTQPQVVAALAVDGHASRSRVALLVTLAVLLGLPLGRRFVKARSA